MKILLQSGLKGPAILNNIIKLKNMHVNKLRNRFSRNNAISN